MQTRNEINAKLIASDLDKLKTLKGMGVTSIILMVIGCVICFVAVFVGALMASNNTIGDGQEFVELTPSELASIFVPIALGAVLISVGVILNWVGSIMILSVAWNSPRLKDKNFLWGILGLLVIGSIAILIFANTKLETKFELERINNGNENFNNYQKIIDEVNETYFNEKLEKHEYDILAIKLCAKLEAIFKSKYQLEGSLKEMTRNFYSENFDNAKTLFKLIRYRNSISHAVHDVDYKIDGEFLKQNWEIIKQLEVVKK